MENLNDQIVENQKIEDEDEDEDPIISPKIFYLWLGFAALIFIVILIFLLVYFLH